VDPLRIAAGIDHRCTRPGAFAEEVDVLVAEGAAGSVDVVDALRECVSGEIDTVFPDTVRAGLVRLCVGAERLLGEEAVRVLTCRGHLGTVQLRRAVDAAVADHHDVVLVCEPAGEREVHVRDPRTALKSEDRNARLP
jgi:hypothetical protein